MESDSDIDEIVQNDISPPPIDDNFKTKLVNLKKQLHAVVITGPKLGTPNAQSDKVFNTYREHIINIYKLFKKAQNGTITNTNTNLSQFPEDSRESIRNLLEFINSYFKSPKNKTEDMLPYEHAIENFKNYPYTLSIQY
jgi:uncharacterized protein YjdB